MRAGAAAPGSWAALLAAGCGTGGIVKSGDQTRRGKQLFQAKCGGCHTLEAAGTHGTVGPNLDEAFASDRKQGFEQVDDPAGRSPADLARRAGRCRPTSSREPTRTRSPRSWPPPQEFRARAAAGAAATSGKDIFSANCGSCHTLAAAGTSGTVGPNLDDLKPSLARAERQVTNGGAIMPAFKGKLTDAQIKAVAKYVSDNAGKK